MEAEIRISLWGYTGIMEKEMETVGVIVIIIGIYVRIILGLYWDDGNGNYFSGLRVWGLG